MTLREMFQYIRDLEDEIERAKKSIEANDPDFKKKYFLKKSKKTLK